jgi:hypothetical protein
MTEGSGLKPGMIGFSILVMMELRASVDTKYFRMSMIDPV